MEICVIDDEKYFCDIISQKISSFFQTRHIHCSIDCYSSFHEYQAYDCYFIDIVLKETNGMMIAKEILKHDPNASLIFISSYEQYVFQVMPFHFFYFVRKDCLDEDLHHALTKFINYQPSYHKVEILSQRERLYVNEEDIICIEVQGRISTLYTHQQVYTTNTPLKEIYKKLNTQLFYKVNSYSLVHFKYVKELCKKENALLLTNGKKIYIGRRYKDVFKAYMHYISRQDHE